MAKEKVDNDKIRQRVTENIISLLQITGRDAQDISKKLNNEGDIFHDLGIDSIEAMDLLGMLEKEFETTFDVDKFAHRRTMDDIVEFIAVQLLPQNG